MNTKKYISALICGLLLFISTPTYAAVDIVANGTAGIVSQASPYDYTNLTVAASTNVVWAVAVFGFNPGTVTATWDFGASAQTMTQIGTNCKENTWDKWVVLFGLVSPTTGNKTLRWTYTGTGEVSTNASTFSGADQTGGTTTFPGFTCANGSSTTPAVTITSSANNMAVAGVIQDSGTFSARSHTSLWENNTRGSGAQRTLTTASGASVAFTWTIAGAQWGAAGNDIAAAGGGGGSTNDTSKFMLLGVGQ
jgi:hypothetical protein